MNDKDVLDLSIQSAFRDYQKKVNQAGHELYGQISKEINDMPEVESEIQPFAPQVIILRNGQRMPFSEWQKKHGISADKFSQYFSFRDKKLDRPDFQLSELLFPIIDEFRKQVRKPVFINSAYRSQAEQDNLIAKGHRAVKNSPHTQGMAIDIDTLTPAETYRHVRILEAVAKKLDIKIRIGFRKYLKDGNTFIHFDVAPEYFAKGKPFHHINHAEAWERQARW